MTTFYKDKQHIINWLDRYEIKNYTFIPDDKYGFVIDVSADVNLRDKDFTNIPVKFNKIAGFFDCGNNKLENLEFCPQTVSGSFYCNGNKLTSLEFCPQKINGNFYCIGNQLISLEFCPEEVSGNFDCSENQLTSFDFCPQTVGGDFYFYENPELKEIQEITDFKQIYLEHKKTLITKFSNKLNKKLPNENSKKSTKIKI